MHERAKSAGKRIVPQTTDRGGPRAYIGILKPPAEIQDRHVDTLFTIYKQLANANKELIGQNIAAFSVSLKGVEKAHELLVRTLGNMSKGDKVRISEAAKKQLVEFLQQRILIIEKETRSAGSEKLLEEKKHAEALLGKLDAKSGAAHIARGTPEGNLREFGKVYGELLNAMDEMFQATTVPGRFGEVQALGQKIRGLAERKKELLSEILGAETSKISAAQRQGMNGFISRRAGAINAQLAQGNLQATRIRELETEKEELKRLWNSLNKGSTA